MMHLEVLQSFFQEDLDHDFYSSITTPEDSSVISSISHFQTISPCDFGVIPSLFDHEMQVVFPMENISQHMEEGIEGISETALEDVLKWWGESEELKSMSSEISMENESCNTMLFQSMDLALMLPPDEMDVDEQTSLCHLLKAYGEAMEMGHKELANVIMGCISEKASPVGGTMERVAFNLFHSENQSDYIKQESMKNFKSAFKAFYEIFPYGRFSHFAANSAILEAIMSSDSGKVHIIDFDMGEGVQWPTMLESLAKLRKDTKLTSIRRYEQSYIFEDTKNQLLDYARTCGLKLEVQEIKIEDLVKEIEGSKDHECLAFNCMVGIPHMGREASRSQVKEFMKVAKQLLSTNKGIITFADGEDLERMKHCGGYSSFFNEHLIHYQALYESMEEKFPDNLTQARIAMESLFVAPYVSSLSWHQKWEDVTMEDLEINESHGLKGWRLRKESLMEAKEMVKERQSSYTIRVEGKYENEMVLEWRGTPLVRVSAWK